MKIILNLSRALGITLLTFLAIFQIAVAQTGDLSNPERWQFGCQRAEIAPKNGIDKEVLYQGNTTLMLAGNGNKSVNGYWFTNVEVESTMAYTFTTNFNAENINEPNRSVLARILWYDEYGKLVNRPEYPATTGTTENGWSIVEETYQVPQNAVVARIELIFRWDDDGQVNFGGTSFRETRQTESRLVKLASIHHRPRNSSGPEENLKQFAALIGQAAEKDADIVCLPEGITLVGTGLNYISASEPVPGPSTKFLGKLAEKHGLYVVAGILERDGETVYNTSVLIDRDGNLAGKYRKVCLPREEIEGGVTPGSELPVFDTDFGKIGMMICWDVSFPEVARTLAFKGAEVLLMPIWGGQLTLAKARALENQVYLVSSTYSMKTAVFDQEGEIIEEATEENPVIVVEVDLNKKKYWHWLGDFKNRIKREMPSREIVNIELN